MVFVFLRLHLVWYSLGPSMLLQMALFHFYGWVIFHCIYMYHIFIHSSANVCLGCFHILAIVNSAAMNTGVHVSFLIIVLSGYMPRCRIARSYGNFILVFWVTPYCFLSSCTNLHGVGNLTKSAHFLIWLNYKNALSIQKNMWEKHVNVLHIQHLKNLNQYLNWLLWPPFKLLTERGEGAGHIPRDSLCQLLCFYV